MRRNQLPSSRNAAQAFRETSRNAAQAFLETAIAAAPSRYCVRTAGTSDGLISRADPAPAEPVKGSALDRALDLVAGVFWRAPRAWSVMRSTNGDKIERWKAHNGRSAISHRHQARMSDDQGLVGDCAAHGLTRRG